MQNHISRAFRTSSYNTPKRTVFRPLYHVFVSMARRMIDVEKKNRQSDDSKEI